MSLKLELPHFRGKRNLFYFLGSQKPNFGGGKTPQKWFIIFNYFAQRTSSSRKEYFHKVLRKSIYIATCTAQIHLYKKGFFFKNPQNVFKGLSLTDWLTHR